jgi:hypothetical protein
MRVATVRVKSLTPYSQSRALESEKREDETHDDFDRRIWPEHMHVGADRQVFVPAVAITQGMATAASYLGKGGELKKKGAATWAQNFTCGLSVAEGPRIGFNADEAKSERVYCHADGRRGSGRRVWRTFPVFEKWESEFVIHILDDTIPEEIFRRVAQAFGLFIGIGRYRPENGGYLGRFIVEKIQIENV